MKATAIPAAQDAHPQIAPAPLTVALPVFVVPSAIFCLALYVGIPLMMRAGLPLSAIFTIALPVPLALMLLASLVALRREGWPFTWNSVKIRFSSRPDESGRMVLGGFTRSLHVWGKSGSLAVAFVCCSGVVARAAPIYQSTFRNRWGGRIYSSQLGYWIHRALAFTLEVLRGTCLLEGLPLTPGTERFHGFPLARSLVDCHLLCGCPEAPQYRRRRAVVARLHFAQAGTRPWQSDLGNSRVFVGCLPHVLDLEFLGSGRQLPTCMALAFVCQKQKNTWPGVIGHTFGNSAILVGIVR